ncbi:MAG: carbamoylphosphate synthase large subunit [Oscillospiraceae bacterium]|nr:carbamoylphosphate synthase large subunit [Oscillospiraceae bacterium]
MNFIFISPAYPVTCTRFCERLSELGVNVLGIGDVAYDALNGPLKSALTEYYYVQSLEDYEQVYHAVAYFVYHYGRADWLESLNEYWLPMEARLRADFNVPHGTRESGIDTLIRKSEMKRVFLKAGIPTARQHIVSDLASGRAFAAQTGYPVIVKPDIGVGANGAQKLKTEEELSAFYEELPDGPYVMEEFLYGDICTYDAVIGPDGEPLFESSSTYAPVLDSVQKDEDIIIYAAAEVPPQLLDLGRRTVRAFGVDSRFVHFEFIQLAKDMDGIGKAGDYAVMEVNMRPAGGHDPDLMNYARSADVFRIYAEMVTFGKRLLPESEDRYICAYAARKDGHVFTHTHEEIMARYGEDIVLQEEMPPIDWPSMGRYVYIARFRTKEEMDRYCDFVLG